MASSRREMSILFSRVALVAAIGAMLALCCAAQDFCPSAADPVYPYWSQCLTPAVYGQPYYLASTITSQALIPEWDESNATYYIRLSDEWGDALTLLPLDYSTGGTVYHNATVRVAVNVSASTYFLSWRSEGDAEWFLQLSASSESDAAADFQIVYAPDVLLPCPLVLGARCEAYYLLSAPGNYTSGLTAYVEDEVTYITLGQEGSNGDLPLILVTSSGNRHTVAVA